SELLFERCRFAEIVVERDSGVVYEDVQRRDARGGRADLILVGHVSLIGVTRVSAGGIGLRIPAKTPDAPRRSASATSASPMPRFAPVISTVLPSSVVPSFIFQASSVVSFLDTREPWDPSRRPGLRRTRSPRPPDPRSPPERDEGRFDHPAQSVPPVPSHMPHCSSRSC